MPHEIRLATFADTAAVVELAALTFPLACPQDADPQAVAAHIATHLSSTQVTRWLRSDDHHLIVADSPAGLMGYALLIHGPAQDPDISAVVGTGPSVELSKIYVRPEAQGTGVARDLMTAALAAAVEQAPGRRVWLGTNGENARAQAFYRKSGFEAVGKRTYVVGGESHDDVVMARSTALAP